MARKNTLFVTFVTWLGTLTSVKDKLPVLHPQYILCWTLVRERGLEPHNLKPTQSSMKTADIFKAY